MKPLEEIQLHDSWKQVLAREFRSQYMDELRAFLAAEGRNGGFYPPPPLIFRAFDLTPFDQVKVCVIGQDPYHGPGQAEGLCFSVAPGVDHPPSLRNVFKELESDMLLPYPRSGSLVPWATNGVLLMNNVLTVAPAQAGSHRGRGWERFTEAVVDALNEQREHVVFFLWGRDAQEKGLLIDRSRHLVIESPHPSPLSAHRGFFGSKPFSRANEYLEANGRGAIDWSVE